MLDLILGPDHKINTFSVLEKMLHAPNKNNRKRFLLVPEQFSFEMERTLCKLGGDNVSRFAEVLSLTRLADRIESLYGGAATPWLDKGGRILAAVQAVEQVKSKLKLFASVCQKPEFLESLISVVDEFGSYGVSTETLLQTSRFFNGQFAQKIEEIALLYESYLAVCANAKDPVSRLVNLRNVLAEEEFAADKEFFICLFGDFTTLEREIVEELIRNAPEVTIALPDESASGTHVFSASHSALKSIVSFCKSNAIDVKQRNLGFSLQVPADLLHLQTHISQSGFNLFTGTADNVSFSRFETEEQECRKTAEMINSIIKSGGRYRDIAIACSDFSVYEPILSRILDLAAIPHFSSDHDPVTALSGARIVLAALWAISSGLEQDAVLDFLKLNSTSLTMDQCDRLENYALLWNITGCLWAQEWTWHPAGLGVNWTESHMHELEELNHWRQLGLSALLTLRVRLVKAENIVQMAEAVFDFMTAIDLPAQMQQLADRLYANGEYEHSQQYCQLYDILVDSLEQMSIVMPNAVRSVEDFYRLFERLLGQYTVSAVPATVDEVLIGEISSFRGKAVDHLIILGAEEGLFPACSSGNSVFTEEERKQLLLSGLSMAPLRVDAVDRELSHIYSTIRSAVKSCRIFCTGEPSYLLTKASAMFGGITQENSNHILLNENEVASALLRAGNKPSSPLMQELCERCEYSFGKLDKTQVRGLYGDTVRLSASSIDKFTSCRFAYFLRYGLNALERKPVKFDASAFGTFVHAVLELTAREVMHNGGFKKVSDEELREIAQNAMEAYAAEQLKDLMENNPRFRYLFSRNCDEALAVVQDMTDELRVSDFEPSKFEFKFADDGQMPPIHIEGKTMKGSVKGFVDRVDIYKHGETSYVRVVDYKTGRKSFDYAEIAEGEGMQMLIYLFALTQNGATVFGNKLQPAGVLYHLARQDVISDQTRLSEESVRKKQQSNRVRKGLIADNDVVISAMEHFEESPKYLPFSVKKDQRVGDLADSRQMKLLQNHVMDTLAKLTDEIGSGNVHPNPIIRGADNSACTYCEYSSVCQKDFLQHEMRIIKKISNKQFFEQLEQEGKEHG